MLERIAEDHRHFHILLDLLEQKIERLEQGGGINMPMLQELIDYLHRYADRCHHPLEDRIYQFYLERTGQPALTLHKLAEEHQALAQATSAILATVTMILADQVVPRQRLVANLRQFLTLQRNHLSYEDQQLLPKIAATLSEDDWQSLTPQLQQLCQSDPLFANSGADYQHLRDYLAAS
ncbi:hemerythrin domain-containing protein [Ferrimonas senticii]|uniref:hemerythrin domain-containing protein n=1 Tax=Ferrimonas senticii TaxID=394566 RepID=UPI0004109B48|nr:hemerythrin domain-containing protein [Ferrimonas senticii]